MHVRFPNSMFTATICMLLGVACLHAQLPGAPPTEMQAGGAAAEPQAKKPDGILVDQAIAVVNGELVLESDIDEEKRFQAFQPLRDTSGSFSRATAVERLIDRALILQQATLQPDDKVSIEDARAQLQALRKDIPACKQYQCETEAGWQKFVQAQGFTMAELEDRWRQRMEVLKFIEIRFRAGIEITPQQIKTYYEKTLVPEYRAQQATPPPVESISDRIQEILLQRQVGNLLGDWLQSLKAQGTVRIIKPGEVTP